MSENPSKVIYHFLIAITGILIIFGFGYLPPIEPITPMGMRVLGIFLGMIFLWSFTDLIWSSLLGIVAIVISGFAPLATVVHMSFGDRVPTLILFAMILFGAIQDSGIISHISRCFLTRKCINGKPVMFSFVFIYATYVLSALSASVLPALLFMWAILYRVLEDVGYKKGDAYTAIMVIGTLFGAISGQGAKPFTGSALMMVGAYEKVAGVPMDYLKYMVFGFILSSLGIVLYALMIKFIFRPDMSKISDISIERFERDKLPPMDTRQNIMMASLVGFLTLVMLPSILPKSIAPIALLARIGPIGVCLLFIVGLSIMRVQGKALFSFKEVAAKHVNWQIYILVSMAMAISSAMMDKSTGITQFLAQSLEPLANGMSFNAFVASLITVSSLITQIANNGVVGVLLMPVIQFFCLQEGGNFEAVATLIIFILHIAVLTPAGSIYSAVLFGNKEWVTPFEIVKYGWYIVIMAILLYVFVGMPLMYFIYA